jgi:HEAT repeat protein
MSAAGDTGVLDGLAEIPWRDLSHAYGSAEDVPGLLRAIASGDDEAADDAVHELFGNIWHQGSVYEATGYAVPFLARMAAAGLASRDLAQLLGCIAESGDDWSAAPGGARAGVAAQASLLAPLLGSPDGEVRTAVAWALAQSGPAAEVFPALRARWEAEGDPPVRAALLRAMSELDPPRALSTADRTLVSGTPGERFVAAWARVTAGLPWTSDDSRAAAAWFAAGLNLPPGWWPGQNDGPLEGLLTALAGRGDLDAATACGLQCLAQAGSSRARAAAAWALDRLAERYRVPGPELAAALVPAVADEASRRNALWLLRTLDLAAAARAGSTRALADALFAAADTRQPDLTANDALACLFDLGDPRAPALLARDLRHRAEVLATGGIAESSRPWMALEFDPALLNAIRGVLASHDDTDALLPGRPGHTRRNAVAGLLDLLAFWGPAAAPATPEITAVLPVAPAAAARALAAVAGPAPEAARALRAAWRPKANGTVQRILAAGTLRDLTGDTGPLLAAIRDGLGQPRAVPFAARAARSIGDPPRWLIAALEAALAASGKNQYARGEATRTLCQFAADKADVLPALAELLAPGHGVLSGPAGGYAVLEAARDLGPAAHSLIPALTPFLADPAFCPAAAEAILRAGLGDVTLATLASHLVTAVSADGGRHHEHALNLLRDIQRRDQQAVSPAMLAQLRDTAERPDRVIRSGLADNIIRQDEALRTLIRDFLDATRAPADAPRPAGSS